jgi:hypothetical protein
MGKEEVDFYINTMNSAAQLIERATCQFFVLKDNAPKSHGTGVAIKVGNNHFILTAAHVVDGLDEVLYLRSENGLMFFPYDYLFNKIDIDRKDDKVDTAIIILNDDVVKQLNGYYTFIQNSELGINHRLIDVPCYMAYGYPASMTKMKYGSAAISGLPSYFTTRPADKDIYEILKCATDANIIISYEKQKLVDTITQQRGVGPDLYGMSGCGLWYVSLDPKNPGIKLVGILTEWPVNNRSYVICTRIDVFTENLRQTQGLNLPTSATFLVDFHD